MKTHPAPPTTLREILVHHDWAMEKVLGAAGEVPVAALDARLDPVPTTLRRVLHHLVESERLWLRRWREEPVSGLTEPDPSVSVQELADGWRTTAAARNSFLDTLGEAGERRAVRYRNLRGDGFQHPLGDLILHVANHGAHHRGQAHSLLRRAGGAPLPLDYLSLRWERPTSREGAGEGVAPEAHPTFDPDTILEYFRYADWAGGQVLERAAGLEDADLDREFPIGLGTLRGTLLHIHDSEAWWVGTWRGRDPGAFQCLPEGTPVPDLIREHEATAKSRNEFLAAADPSDLLRVLSVEEPDGAVRYCRLGESALQLCLHGTHHRAPLVWKLRALGVDPPGLDYVTWLRAGSP